MGPSFGLDIWGTENLPHLGNQSTNLLPSCPQISHYTDWASPSLKFQFLCSNHNVFWTCTHEDLRGNIRIFLRVSVWIKIEIALPFRVGCFDVTAYYKTPKYSLRSNVIITEQCCRELQLNLEKVSMYQGPFWDASISSAVQGTPLYFRTRMVSAIFITVRCLDEIWTKWNNFPPSSPIFLRYILVLFAHVSLGIPRGFIP